MPAMSRLEAVFCRSAPWRVFTQRAVLPWALQGLRPEGRVLEIGAGSGAMAYGLLSSYPGVTMTVTDVDAQMVCAAAGRLAPFGDRVTARRADATALPFPGCSFDTVLSWIMLHHTLKWEQALAEAVRVVRPGGHVVGYDLLSTAPLRLLHLAEGAPFRMMRLPELRGALRALPIDQAILTPSLARAAVRFTLRKASPSQSPPPGDEAPCGPA
jgi:ubiquinone/menaquinone biosynthesis C-methylase UbiE